MRRISLSQKTFGITQPTNLAELKSIYRSLIKEWHPDKLQNDEDRLALAESKSKEIVDAYHFLVSIAPETHAANSDEYDQITANAFIDDFEYKGITLKIIFQDGSIYEYFGVPKNIYIKMVNSGAIARFARRHIFNSYTFRKAGNKTIA